MNRILQVYVLISGTTNNCLCNYKSQWHYYSSEAYVIAKMLHTCWEVAINSYDYNNYKFQLHENCNSSKYNIIYIIIYVFV